MPVLHLRATFILLTRPSSRYKQPVIRACSIPSFGPCAPLVVKARELPPFTRRYSTSKYTQAAKELSQKDLEEQEARSDSGISQEKAKQIRTPWHREGSSVPPVARPRSASAMTKGE